MKQYIHPEDLKLLEDTRHAVRSFIVNCSQLEVVSAHYRPESTVCDVSGEKNPEVVYVLKNNRKQTIRVAEKYLSILANIIEITGAEVWFEKIKAWKKEYDEKQKEIAKKQREDDELLKKQHSHKVITRRKSP